MARASVLILILGLFCFLNFSCRDKSTEPLVRQPIHFSAQSGRCISHGLPRYNYLDSLFTYSFDDSLLIDFSLIGNCCPDSNRFSISFSTEADTLNILVSDTAGNLCDCICTYIIHAEFADLPEDHYFVRCNQYGRIEPVHLVEIFRK